jgi:ABC-type antimicrobial peptide transport system permease subunit
MKEIIKQRLTRCVILSITIIAMMFASGIVRYFIQAQTVGIKTETNAGYFNGTVDMGTVEITRASSNTLYGIVNFILTASICVLVIIFMYNGSFIVYKYFKNREKKDEKD